MTTQPVDTGWHNITLITLKKTLNHFLHNIQYSLDNTTRRHWAVNNVNLVTIYENIDPFMKQCNIENILRRHLTVNDIILT